MLKRIFFLCLPFFSFASIELENDFEQTHLQSALETIELNLDSFLQLNKNTEIDLEKAQKKEEQLKNIEPKNEQKNKKSKTQEVKKNLKKDQNLTQEEILQAKKAQEKNKNIKDHYLFNASYQKPVANFIFLEDEFKGTHSTIFGLYEQAYQSKYNSYYLFIKPDLLVQKQKNNDKLTQKENQTKANADETNSKNITQQEKTKSKNKIAKSDEDQKQQNQIIQEKDTKQETINFKSKADKTNISFGNLKWQYLEKNNKLKQDHLEYIAKYLEQIVKKADKNIPNIIITKGITSAFVIKNISMDLEFKNNFKAIVLLNSYIPEINLNKELINELKSANIKTLEFVDPNHPFAKENLKKKKLSLEKEKYRQSLHAEGFDAKWIFKEIEGFFKEE